MPTIDLIDIDVAKRTIAVYERIGDGRMNRINYVDDSSLPRYTKSSPVGLIIQALVKMLDGRLKEYNESA